MLSYRKVPQCRICSLGTITDQIDQALLNRASYSTVVDQFQSHFPLDKPLTKAVVYSHFHHMQDAIQEAAIILHGDKQAAAAAASLSALTAPVPTPPTLNPNNPVQSPAAQQVFQAAVRRELDEIETIQFLAQSGLDDLKALTPTSAEPEGSYELDKKLARNTIRTSTAKIVSESAKIKKMAAESTEQQTRAEKGRVVFKMFAIVREALAVVPAEYRPLVAEALKASFAQDDELQELLKVHTSGTP